MDRIGEKIRIATGALTPIVALGTFGISAVFSTAYTWPSDPFSVIGGEGTLTATFFNAGLIATGLLALPFAVQLWSVNRRAEGILYAVMGLMFAGAGLFPMSGDSVAHDLFGSGIFLGIWLLLWAAGISEWHSGDHRRGMTTVVLGSITLLVWLPYDFGLTWAQIGWGAAELVVVLCFGVWCISTAGRLWRRLSDRTAAGNGEGYIGI